jgi:hypothetical protein
MELVERCFEDLSDLQYKIFSCDLGGKYNPIALVIRFEGVHGVGSAGNADSDFMCAITRAALVAWQPHAIVFDLRKFDYKFGNSIWRVFGQGIPSSGIEGLPCALVVQGEPSPSSIPPSFDDLELAIEFVGNPARAALEAAITGLENRQ